MKKDNIVVNYYDLKKLHGECSRITVIPVIPVWGLGLNRIVRKQVKLCTCSKQLLSVKYYFLLCCTKDTFENLQMLDYNVGTAF